MLTSVDMSCLMHLDGLIRRPKKPLRVLHIAELLAEAQRQDEAPRTAAPAVTC